MGALVGFIVTFLGASIFNIAAGVPFLPLQTLWVNFTTQVFQAIGLGLRQAGAGHHGAPAPPADEKILPRERLAWLGVLGLVLGDRDAGRDRLGRACVRHATSPGPWA